MDEIRGRIYSMADEKYKEFQSKLLPDIKNYVGVRLPQLRKLAKEVTKKDAGQYLDAVLKRNPEEELFEEIMLQGMIIGYMKSDISDIFSFTERFLPKIDNWSVCDSFCSGFKHARNYPEQTWNWLQKYLNTDNGNQEYEIRFAVVMLLNYYVDEIHLPDLFMIFDRITYDAYYVKMAVAWAISVCYVKFPEASMKYLQNNKLDYFTYNKALQKITESLSVSVEDKSLIRSMKRKV